MLCLWTFRDYTELGGRLSNPSARDSVSTTVESSHFPGTGVPNTGGYPSDSPTTVGTPSRDHVVLEDVSVRVDLCRRVQKKSATYLNETSRLSYRMSLLFKNS